MSVQIAASWLAAACLCSLASAPADEPPEKSVTVARPFLWKIEPRTEDGQPSWLFGTIHVPDKSITTLHPAAQAAFDSADAAYFEVDFLKDQAEQAKAVSLPDGERLEDLVDAELVDRLDARLKKISPLFSRGALPSVHVVVWPLLLGNLEAQVRSLGEPPLDLALYFAAQQAGKTIGGLEKPGEQLVKLIEMPLDDQIKFLEASLDGMDADDEAGIPRLKQTMEKYASGDPKEFDDFMQSEMERIDLPEELTDRILTALLSDRNQRMAASIDALMKDSKDTTSFFAVGVAHLTGEDSVQDFLRKKGYQVTGPHAELDE